MKEKGNTTNRKLDHINICLTNNVEFKSKTPGFEDVSFIHRAIPTIDMSEITFNTSFLDFEFNAPLIIGAMTGGHPEAKEINENLAIAAEELGIGMGVGSQRAAIENDNVIETYSIVRERAPNTFIIANIGAPQIVELDNTAIKKIINMISANALAIHLNKLQESIQPEGDTSFKNFIVKLSELTKQLKLPVIVKETGAGISKEDAKSLADAGVSAIDISGAGGTSWAGVEALRSKNKYGEFFWDWGIPTVISLVECLNTVKLPIIASGGVRSGLDVAKALALGAEIVEISLPLLKKAKKNVKAVKRYLEHILQQLKIVMYLVGANTIDDLKNTPLIISGNTANWLKLRGIDVSVYATR
ncbi:MAG: type 2 isopentenyl-diphosphate Delta-isomerase [Candidatus Odinarchaeia archaeon]